VTPRAIKIVVATTVARSGTAQSPPRLACEANGQNPRKNASIVTVSVCMSVSTSGAGKGNSKTHVPDAAQPSSNTRPKVADVFNAMANVNRATMEMQAQISIATRVGAPTAANALTVCLVDENPGQNKGKIRTGTHRKRAAIQLATRAVAWEAIPARGLSVSTPHSRRLRGECDPALAHRASTFCLWPLSEDNKHRRINRERRRRSLEHFPGGSSPTSG